MTPITLAATATRVSREAARETPDIETSSEAYAGRFAGPAGAWMVRAQEEAVIGLLSRWPRATVLEVGGGHGQLTGPLVRRGYRVTVFGSEASCRQRIAPLVTAGQCRFMTGNLLALPYPAQAFDVAVSVRLLPHLADWRRAIAEMARVARHAVIVDYPTVRSLNALTPALFGVKKQLEGNTRTYRSFDDREVTEAFAAHGWARRQRIAQFFWPMVLHRTLRAPAISSALEGVPRALRLTDWVGSPAVALFVKTAHR